MASEFSFELAIRRLALLSILKPDQDAYLRHVYRWYSENFHTPLHLVPDLPLDHVLQNYWEHKYERMKPYQLELERNELTEDDEARRARERAEEAEETDIEVFRIETEKEEAEATARRLKAAAKKLEDIAKGNIQKALVTAQIGKSDAIKIEEYEDPTETTIPAPPQQQPLPISLPPSKPLPPDIIFHFDDPSEIVDEGVSDD